MPPVIIEADRTYSNGLFDTDFAIPKAPRFSRDGRFVVEYATVAAPNEWFAHVMLRSDDECQIRAAASVVCDSTRRVPSDIGSYRIVDRATGAVIETLAV